MDQQTGKLHFCFVWVIQLQKFSSRSERSESHIRFPSLGVQHWEITEAEQKEQEMDKFLEM